MSLDGSDLAIIVPLWQRTKHIERVYDSARAATPKARIVFVASTEDDAVAEGIEDLHSRVMADADDGLGFQCEWVLGAGGTRGDYAAKINAGYRATTEPFLFTGADDLDFHPGWYDAARALITYREMRPGPLGRVALHSEIGVVGTVDLCNGRTANGDHSTHSLVARWYADCCAIVDQPGAIYCESYYHEYTDDELVGYAKSKGAYAHSYESIVEHLHPNVAKSPDDVTYRRGRAMSRSSRRTFTMRRRLWEGARR